MKKCDNVRRYPFPHLPAYPAHPRTLPEPVRAFALGSTGDGLADLTKYMEEVERIFNLLATRKSHKAVQPPPAESQLALQTPAQSSADALIAGFSQALQPVMTMMAQAMGMAAGPQMQIQPPGGPIIRPPIQLSDGHDGPGQGRRSTGEVSQGWGVVGGVGVGSLRSPLGVSTTVEFSKP